MAGGGPALGAGSLPRGPLGAEGRKHDQGGGGALLWVVIFFSFGF